MMTAHRAPVLLQEGPDLADDVEEVQFVGSSFMMKPAS
jgi:hypothetical protein